MSSWRPPLDGSEFSQTADSLEAGTPCQLLFCSCWANYLCIPGSTTFLRQSSAQLSRFTGSWAPAYWSPLTNNPWRTNCPCVKSPSNGKSSFSSITRACAWTAAIGWTFLWKIWSWWKSKPSTFCFPSTKLNYSAISSLADGSWGCSSTFTRHYYVKASSALCSDLRKFPNPPPRRPKQKTEKLRFLCASAVSSLLVAASP